MKGIFIFVFVLRCSISFSQVQDSTKVIDASMRSRLNSTKICHSLRVGVGFQKSFVTEIGYSRMEYSTGCTGFGSKTYYTTLEFIPKTKNYNPIFALKVGLEYNLSILAVGLETKYRTDFNNKDFILIPKIGFGLSYINAFYGYNLSTTKNIFSSTNNHQFSIIFSFPLKTKQL